LDNNMKKTIAFVLMAAAGGYATAQPNVSVSIGINQPGVYGRINIGELPRPALILPQPVIITPPLYVVERQPIYLYVPAAQQQDWRHYCGRYSACGQPVYFVQDQWVRERYQVEHPGWDRGRQRGWSEQDEHGHGDGDREDRKGKGHKDKHKSDRDD
jgi:hypothetical protein